MTKLSADEIDVWVFDLDHTLYPPERTLFDQIEARMAHYVMRVLGLSLEEAHALRHDYWRTHGTTLAGLMHHHGIDPEPYLADVHDIDHSVLDASPDLRAAITALPGRKVVYTNGSRGHAEKVTEVLGLAGCFEALYGIEDAGYAPKPRRDAFERVFALAGVSGARAAMFEDDPRNLRAPHEMGLATIHVSPRPETAEHIHHRTEDLTGFLSGLR